MMMMVMIHSIVGQSSPRDIPDDNDDNKDNDDNDDNKDNDDNDDMIIHSIVMLTRAGNGGPMGCRC